MTTSAFRQQIIAKYGKPLATRRRSPEVAASCGVTLVSGLTPIKFVLRPMFLNNPENMALPGARSWLGVGPAIR